jgi:methionine-rich copper-binding protein CopC
MNSQIESTTFHRRVAALPVGLLCLIVLCGQQAGAHAKLLASVPAGNSTVASPSLIELHFNEAIEVKLSSLKLAGGDGKEVPVKPSSAAVDAKTLAVAPAAPLAAGSYTVSWSVVSDDGHRQKGTIRFTVR